MLFNIVDPEQFDDCLKNIENAFYYPEAIPKLSPKEISNNRIYFKNHGKYKSYRNILTEN